MSSVSFHAVVADVFADVLSDCVQSILRFVQCVGAIVAVVVHFAYLFISDVCVCRLPMVSRVVARFFVLSDVSCAFSFCGLLHACVRVSFFCVRGFAMCGMHAGQLQR